MNNNDPLNVACSLILLALLVFIVVFVLVLPLISMQQCLDATHQYLECHNTIYRVDQRFNTLGDNHEPT